MKIISIVITTIAILGYLLTTFLLINDPVARSTRDGIHLMNFFIWFIIPLILWVVYLLFQYPDKIEKTKNSTINQNTTNSADSPKSITHDYVDSELISLNNRITEYTKELEQLYQDLELLKRSQEKDFIDNSTFSNEEKKIIEKISRYKSDITYCEQKSSTVQILRRELNDLEDLVKRKILDESEMEIKKRALISNEINKMNQPF